MSRSEREYIKNIIEEVLFYNKYLSVTECAAMFKKDRRNILKAINNGDIKATRIGSSYRIPQLQFLK